MKYNFNGFTTKANEALNQAIGSAEQLGHTYVGSEHLLLGLLKIGTGVAAAVLNKNGITVSPSACPAPAAREELLRRRCSLSFVFLLLLLLCELQQLVN